MKQNKTTSNQQDDSDVKTAIEKIGFWKNANLVTLGDDFHGCYGNPLIDEYTNENQDNRVGSYHLNREQVKIISKKFPVGSYSGFRIHMALDKPIKIPGHLNFRPILQLMSNESNQPSDDYFEFNPGDAVICPINTTPTGPKPPNERPDRVPLEYLNIVSKSWRKIGTALIDDAFIALLAVSPEEPSQRERTRHCEISERHNPRLYNFLKFIFTDKRQRLDSVGFHLGLDMNKNLMNDRFTFTPVIRMDISWWPGSDCGLTDYPQLEEFLSDFGDWEAYKKNHSHEECENIVSQFESLFLKGFSDFLVKGKQTVRNFSPSPFFIKAIKDDGRVILTNLQQYVQFCPPYC